MNDTSLVLEFTDTDESEIFEAFFASYQEAFVLPDEMEDRDGFAECLRLNHGQAKRDLSGRYGPFREVCGIARDRESGALVGGANFIAMPFGRGGKLELVTANLNYIFIDKAMRGKGMLRRLVTELQASISTLFLNADRRTATPALIFVEQNDPLLLTAEEYARDTSFSGIDQFDRLRIWGRLGARIVDFPYVQPPLSAAQQADDGLIYSVIGADALRLEACLLHHHLQAFFGISVLKGAVLRSVPSAWDQIADLAARCSGGETVVLLDPLPALNRLDRNAEALLIQEQKRPLREWLRELVVT